MTDHPRLHYLDSLRGIAAVTVICSHFVLGYGLPIHLQWMATTPLHAFWHGDGAVSFFFVLSGLVLALPYVKGEPIKIAFLSYGLNRLFRILPLIFCILLLSILARTFLFHPFVTQPPQSGWMQWFWHKQLTLKSILELVPQGWTLAIELPVSLLIPFVALLMKKNNVVVVLITYTLILTLGLNRYAIDFILGILIASNIRGLKILWDKFSSLSHVLFFILGILFYTAVFFIPTQVYSALNFVLIDLSAMGCSIILTSALCSSRIQYFLSHQVFLFLGKISYSLYLTHFMILVCATPWVISSFNNIGLQDEYFPRVIGLFFTLGSTVLISAITYFLIEKPFIKIGKKIGSRIFVSR